MLQQICTQLPNSVIVIGLLGYATFEWFMGNTSFGSTLGLVVESPLTWIMNQIKKV